MKKSIFRPEVSEKNSESWLGEIRLSSPISHRVWAIAAVVCTSLLLAWLIFGEYTRRGHVTGVLVPVGGFARIKARAPGAVSRILVHEGGRVSVGDALIEIDNDRYTEANESLAGDVALTFEQEKRTLQEDIESARRASVRKKRDLQRQQTLIREQIARADEMLALFREEAKSQAALLSKIEPASVQGFVSSVQVQQQRSSVATANAAVNRQITEKLLLEQQLRVIDTEFAQLPDDLNSEINGSLRQLARSQAATDRNEADRKTVVRAMVDGTVSSVLVHPGQTVGVNSSLLSIVPSDAPLEAELYVSNSIVGFVRQGDTVSLRYQAFPYQKFGVHSARVEYVSAGVLSPAEIAEVAGPGNIAEPMYRVRASLRRQTIDIYGEKKTLAAGMAVNGAIMLDRRRVYEWIFEPMYAMRRKMEEER